MVNIGSWFCFYCCCCICLVLETVKECWNKISLSTTFACTARHIFWLFICASFRNREDDHWSSHRLLVCWNEQTKYSTWTNYPSWRNSRESSTTSSVLWAFEQICGCCRRCGLKMIYWIRKALSRQLGLLISNGNRTEWSTIQGVIGRVISNRPSA